MERKLQTWFLGAREYQDADSEQDDDPVERMPVVTNLFRRVRRIRYKVSRLDDFGSNSFVTLLFMYEMDNDSLWEVKFDMGYKYGYNLEAESDDGDPYITKVTVGSIENAPDGRLRVRDCAEFTLTLALNRSAGRSEFVSPTIRPVLLSSPSRQHAFHALGEIALRFMQRLESEDSESDFTTSNSEDVYLLMTSVIPQFLEGVRSQSTTRALVDPSILSAPAIYERH